jgi:hypothetical protein
MRATRRAPRALAGIACAATAMGGLARASSPTYHITELGLNDAVHSDAAGRYHSQAALANAAGQVVGYSGQYDAAADSFIMGSVWHFDGAATHRMGLLDAEHTTSAGFQFSNVNNLNNAGQAAGVSYRYASGAYAGQSSWVYDNGVTKRVGFFDAYHTSSSDYRFTEITGFNEAGQAIGNSASYPNILEQGLSAWFYNGASTTRIGFTGAAYTSATGLQESHAIALNNAGQVVGTSTQMSADPGQTAWIWSAGTITTIGLTSGAHASTSGRTWNDVAFLNDAGHVAGTSVRFAGEIESGSSAWIYNGSTTNVIGLVDSEHTSSTGQQYSSVTVMNQASQVVGSSDRYIGTNSAGYSAWIYSGGVTTGMGLIDSRHMSDSGIRYSDVVALNEAGVAMGISTRFNHEQLWGQSAWVHKAGATQQIGLLDAAHESTDGYRYDTPEYLNQAGQIVGSSSEFFGGSEPGVATWFYDGSTSVQTGLLDARHTRIDGARYSQHRDLNDSGQAIGISVRYSDTDMGQRGQSGWLYDHATNHTYPLVFSEDTDGSAETSPNSLSGEGVVLGTYRQYAPGQSDLVPFYWSIADGFHRVDDIVSGGLEANGWVTLGEPVLTIEHSSRYLIGSGVCSDFWTHAYRLALGGGGAWNNPAGGSWQVGSNWNFGSAPTSGDDAIFSLAGSYAVTLASDGAAHDLTVSAGNVALHMNTHAIHVSHALNISGATLAIDGGQLRTSAVNIETGGKLDLTNASGSLIVDYGGGTSSFNAIRTLIVAGRNGGSWDGATGITSSAAAADHQKSVGIADSIIEPHSILVALTFSGDANLDGKVDVTDLGALATNWQTSSVWSGGDFNYDAFVDVSDLGVLATNWQAGASGAASLEQALASMGLSLASVPEPTSPIAIALIAFCCTSRRRKNKR